MPNYHPPRFSQRNKLAREKRKEKKKKKERTARHDSVRQNLEDKKDNNANNIFLLLSI